MISSSKLKWEWIIIVVLSIIILVGGIFLISDKKEQAQQTVEQDIPVEVKVETEKDKLLKKYEKLEQAYNSTIKEIESVVDDDNVNLDILKENLTQILETIKEEKEKISTEVPDSAKLIADDKTKQLDELLVMSKEVLAERIVEMKENNEKLTIDNRKLYYNLKKSVEHLEQEKSKNIHFNEETGKIKLKIATLKLEGISTGKEMRQLKKELEEAEKRLIESNKIIKIQNEQIEDLGEIIRKVNIDCYYIYERGNSIEEAKVYLSSQGISEKYVKYFVRKKPDIYVEFKIAKDLFGTEIEKVELKLYNSLNVEIYNIMKLVSSEHLKIIIPNRNFNPGKYSISLKAGDEDLILDERYWLKIAN
jgi:chromosome segregation ATPase